MPAWLALEILLPGAERASVLLKKNQAGARPGVAEVVCHRPTHITSVGAAADNKWRQNNSFSRHPLPVGEDAPASVRRFSHMGSLALAPLPHTQTDIEGGGSREDRDASGSSAVPESIGGDHGSSVAD